MLLVMLVSILIPVLGKAREAARYTAWMAMSKSMQADPRISLYYNFEGQTGDEISASGEPIVENKSTGDPMALVSSEESQAGAQDPTLRYSVMGDSHPNNDNKGALPTFAYKEGRLTGKTAMRFYGKANNINAGSKEGSFLRPEYWAGIVSQGEFQVGMWMKLAPLNYVKAISWGTNNVDGGFFSYQSGRNNEGNTPHFQLDNRGMQAEKFDDQVIDVFNDEWHFVVVRLRKPFGTDGDFADPSIPELRDIELSVDGTPFRKPTYFSEFNDDQAINLTVDEMLIGGEASTNSDFISGLVGEVIIWQETTSYTDIKQMYRAGAPHGHARGYWYDFVKP